MRRSLLLLVLAFAGCRSALPVEVDPAPSSGASGGAPAEAVATRADEGGSAPDSEAAAGIRNTLRWKTASEVDNFGFDVYRGDSEEGPFDRLTETPIPGAVTTDEPQSYVFVDDTIEAGRAYWYYVESISLAGVRERFTPIFRAGPKEPEAASD